MMLCGKPASLMRRRPVPARGAAGLIGWVTGALLVAVAAALLPPSSALACSACAWAICCRLGTGGMAACNHYCPSATGHSVINEL